MDGTEGQYEEDMRCAAAFVLENVVISGALEGIAKQTVGRGFDSLSEKQKEIFFRSILPMATLKCKMCGQEIPYSELVLGGTYCGGCEHRMGEDEED